MKYSIRKTEKRYDESPMKFTGFIVFTIVYALAIVSYFYLILNDLVICVIVAIFFFPYAIISFSRYMTKQRIRKLEIQFGEALRFISSSLSAGNTVENSFYEFVSESDTYTKSDLSLIVGEFRIITNRMAMHESLSSAFSSFAERSGSSDIKVFSLALSQICISGGDVVGLVRKTTASLRIKRETEDEIDLILAGPKYNHRIITVMPILIIFLMNFISPDYMSALYHGPGRIIAVIAAILITVAYIIGNKLADIQF